MPERKCQPRHGTVQLESAVSQSFSGFLENYETDLSTLTVTNARNDMLSKIPLT